MNYLADSTFGISGQALALLALLSQKEPTFARERDDYGYRIFTQTFPWHNGREHGVCLTIQTSVASRKALAITFGECRNSDSIFIDSWEMDRLPMNGPTVADFPEVAYNQRQYAGYLDVREAMDIIIGKAQAFYAKEIAKGES